MNSIDSAKNVRSSDPFMSDPCQLKNPIWVKYDCTTPKFQTLLSEGSASTFTAAEMSPIVDINPRGMERQSARRRGERNSNWKGRCERITQNHRSNRTSTTDATNKQLALTWSEGRSSLEQHTVRHRGRGARRRRHIRRAAPRAAEMKRAAASEGLAPLAESKVKDRCFSILTGCDMRCTPMGYRRGNFSAYWAYTTTCAGQPMEKNKKSGRKIATNNLELEYTRWPVPSTTAL